MHLLPSVHGTHAAPPQSMSVSVPSIVLLLHEPPPELVELDVLDELMTDPPMPPMPELVEPDELTADPPMPELDELDDIPPAPP